MVDHRLHLVRGNEGRRHFRSADGGQSFRAGWLQGVAQVATCRRSTQQIRKPAREFFERSGFLSLTFPNHHRPPAEFAQRALMEFVAGGVAFEFLQPPGAAMRWRRAVLAAAVAMPKAAVNEYGGFVFRKNNIGPHEPTPDPSAEGNS